ncbi:phage tail terminator-like protein [uncultured Sneathiella sp.]|uniref:phage tail terminator-like protein n=1 Tax=uncultured Sneathiella sp. TaxID=879315 RepID=UPI0030EB5922|tara:strand:- start:6514 stop:6903 length:390 start_codon:yes stop_codon:yes gene_type:complete
MSYRKIQAALDARLQVYQSEDVAFPARPYYPAHGKAYLQASFLPAPAEGIFLGSGAVELHTGDYRITVHDADMIAAQSRIDALRAHFNKGRVLSFDGLDVHLDGAAVGANEGDLKKVILPLLIFWRSYF